MKKSRLVLLTFVLLSVIPSIFDSQKLFAAQPNKNKLDMVFRNVHLVLNGEQNADFKSGLFTNEQLFNRDTLRVEGQIDVNQGQLKSLELVVNNRRSEILRFISAPMIAVFRGHATLQGNNRVNEVYLRAVGIHPRTGEEIIMNYPQYPIEIQVGYPETSRGENFFDVEFSETKLILPRAGKALDFESVELDPAHLENGRRVRVQGKVQAKSGELLRLMLRTDQSEMPVPLSPTGNTEEYFWNGIISLNEGRPTPVSLSAVSRDPVTGREGRVRVYPESPVNLSLGKDFEINFQDAQIVRPDQNRLPLAARILKKEDLWQGQNLGLVFKVEVKQGSLGALWLQVDTQGTPIVQSAGRAQLIGPGVYEFSHSVSFKEGETHTLSFFATGPFGKDPQTKIDSQYRNIVISYPKLVVTPFKANFTRRHLETYAVSKDFSQIPSDGLKIVSKDPRQITLDASWKVDGGKATNALYSVDNGKTWTAFNQFFSDHALGALVTAKPGETLDILLKLEGVAMNSAGEEVPNSKTEVKDSPTPTRVVIEAPKVMPFDLIFEKPFIKVKGVKKDISQIPGGVLEVSASEPTMRVDVGTDWKTLSGKFYSISFSLGGDGRSRFEKETPSAQGGSAESGIILSTQSEAEITFYAEGYAMDSLGNRGELREIKSPHQVKLRFKKDFQPFSAVLESATVTVNGATKSFSEIGDAGWTVESATPVKALITAHWKKEGGRFMDATVSVDGGLTMGAVMTLDKNTGTAVRELTFSPDELEQSQRGGGLSYYHLALKTNGNATDSAGTKDFPNDWRGIDAPVKARIYVKKPEIKKPVEPQVEITDIKIDNEPLEEIEAELPIEEVEEDGIRVSGNFKSNVEVDHLEVSFDEEQHWEKIEANPHWSFIFKPEVDQDYRAICKAVLKNGTEVKATGYPTNRFRFFSEEDQVSEDPEEVLNQMARAYESKDFSGFMSRVADDFPNRSELEEFLRRDFRDFDGIKVNLFMKRVLDIPDGKSVQVDWEMQFFPSAISKQVNVKGENLEFLFMDDNGKLKLQRMRGENPLFGARSPDVAVSSGAPSSVSQVLQKIEDEGSRAAKAAALGVVGSDITTGAENIPVTFEIVDSFAHYTDGALEEVDFGALATGRPVKGEARIRITDNPKNMDFTGLKLEVTDSLSGDNLTFTGDLEAGETVVFRTTDDVTFDPADAGRSGTLTFVLDPNDKFIAIDREKKTQREPYTLV